MRDDHSVSREQRVLLVVGIVGLAFNLRPAAVSIGPVLDEIRSALHMSDTTAGVLTTLPVLGFAVFGAAAPLLARVVGLHRITLLALCAAVLGIGLRSFTSSAPVFLLLSLLTLAGLATANVLIPSLVKLHFPTRVGRLTSIYTTALAVGLTLASVLTVPIEHGFGSWRWGLFAWAVTALVAAVPWLGLVSHDSKPAETTSTITLAAVARTRVGWALALCFGLQSLQAYAVFGWMAQIYRDAGFSAATAGLLLGVVTGISIPLSFWLPPLTARLANPGWLLTALIACYPCGYVGLIVAPVGGAIAWALLVGVATAVFPVTLTLIGLRARTSEGTAALSGFGQSVGYLVAAAGPFGMGALHEATHGWTVPLLALTAAAVPLLVSALVLSRPSYVEDQLRTAVTG